MKIAISIIFILCFSTTLASKVKTNKSGTPLILVWKNLLNARTVIKEIYDLWSVLLRQPDKGISGALARSDSHEIIGRLIQISSKVTNLEQNVNNIAGTTINKILQSFPSILELKFSMNELRRIELQISFAHNQLKTFLIRGYKNVTKEEINKENISESWINLEGNMYEEVPGREDQNKENDFLNSRSTLKTEDDGWLIEKKTLYDFANWGTSYSQDAPLSLLRRLHNLIQPEFDESGLFDKLKALGEEVITSICNLRQSQYQVLYNLYNTVAITELKGFTVLQFSYMLLKLYNKGNFNVEVQLANDTYVKRSQEKINVIKNALRDADRTFYRCDPKQQVEGKTFTKLTRLLQGYIENEVNLNPYGTCRENCQYYKFTEYNTCFKAEFCAHQPHCKGRVINCKYVDSDMNICTSSSPERRYDWIEYENGKVLGTKGVCERKKLFQVDSWWRYLFWHCSYCLCLCDDNDYDSDRYFNLRDVTSDIENNKIVTGVRLLKNNQVIHIQIQQGVLEPQGVVDKSTLSWKPVDNYTVQNYFVENKIDYFTMNWLERAIDTDEVIAPPKHVLTGVRFRLLGSHVNLEIRVSPINFATGKIFKDESYWVGNDNTEGSLKNPRTEILLNNPDIPIRNGPHFLNSKHDQYIQFQATSFDTDAAQSTVPFIDSQILTSNGFPLSGLGLIHRGKAGSGGFIAPKLISYDFAYHLSDKF